MASKKETQLNTESLFRQMFGNIKDSVNGFFGPGKPLEPVAPKEEVKYRQFDFPVSYNIHNKPRHQEAIDFETLRNLADAYDLLRLAIETRKDQLKRLKWKIKPVEESDTIKDDPRIKQITSIFKNPSPDLTWSSFLAKLMEDVIVIDAAAIIPLKTRKGECIGFDLMDGATIKRVINETGRTPLPPEPAYQQIIKGLAACNYTTDEMYYVMKNHRTNKVYGYSIVEQILMTVNIALRRQHHQLNYFTEGNIPEAMIGVPSEWTPQQIAEFQTYWDMMLEGNMKVKRHAKFVPGNMNVVMTRQEGLKDEYDEWLARIVCYAFSISPAMLIKSNNRAASENQQDLSKEEGVEPFCIFIKDIMDRLINKAFGYTDLEFVFEQEKELDPFVKAQIDQIYIQCGVKKVNEVRAELGMLPLDEEELDAIKPADPNAQKEEPVVEEEKEEDVAEKIAKSIQINFNPTTNVAAPDINLPTINITNPDINIRQPDVFVDVAAPVVKLDVDVEQPTQKQEDKQIIVKRDANGQMVGEVIYKNNK